MKHKKGDMVYILENNMKVSPALIRSCNGGFYTLEIGTSVIRLKEHRIFSTEEAALKSVKVDKNSMQRQKNQYDYMY